MEKVLKKYTTIPEHLYVDRGADNQIERIVAEMERPGYVLVARQMGKTNLLINAKRKLENENRLFVYVDLSNVFKQEMDCYRNIIDTITEPNEEIFEPLQQEILNIREQELPAHKEYSKSLRLILDFFKGDLVIILDEIDALRSADYSDHIFAQIRSNYFLRTNFPVFNRLTYILSGVIEPTELIKDRNKSPFNIGEKIYLEDFTRDEHLSFISKSKLPINEEISDEIYSWTNGNPRLTFDISSEIESLFLEGKSVNKTVIDDLIQKKYLTNFDVAPVDHIRELVRSNKTVRKAVLKLQKGNNELSDEVKQKLYLYGIIGADFKAKTEIKNKIIKKSLSISWINSIEKEVQNALEYGLEKMSDNEFLEAINSLLDYMENSSPKSEEMEICNYNIGYANYHLRQLDTALEYFSKKYEVPTYRDNSKAFVGICNLGLGFKSEGMEILEQIIVEETNDFSYHNALLNVARNLTDERARAYELYQKLFDSTLKNNKSEDIENNRLRTIALFYQAELNFENQKEAEALAKLHEAKSHSTLSDSLFLIFSKYRITKEKDTHYIREIVEKILEFQIEFDVSQTYPISFQETHLLHYVALIFKVNLDLFESLLDYAEAKLYNGSKTKNEIAYEASGIYSDQQEPLLLYILEKDQELNNTLALNIYRDLARNQSSNTPELFFRYFEEYLILFKEGSFLNEKDFYLIVLAIKINSDSKNYSESLKLCTLVETRLKNIKDDKLTFESVIIYYWYSVIYFSLNNSTQSIFYADKTLDLIKTSKQKSTSMVDEKGLKSIAEQLQQIKSSSRIRIPIVNNKKYGRNERIKVKYLDGNIKEGKYKHLEADILSERCKIVLIG